MLESALLAFTLAPECTPAAVERAKGWMRPQRRRGGEPSVRSLVGPALTARGGAITRRG